MGDFVYPWCSKCDKNFPMQWNVYENLEECGNTFYCPHGHALMISRANIVLRLRTAEKNISYKTGVVSKLSKRIESFLGVQTRQRNRLLRGACPYCKQMPKDMVRHIQEHHGPNGK